MFDFLVCALSIPFLTGILVFWVKKPVVVSWLNFGGSSATAATLFWLVKLITVQGTFHQDIFLLDSLSAVFLLIVGFLSFTAALYSVPYMRHELEAGHLTARMIPRYYALFQFFVLTMIFTLVVENLGLLWVAVEATTLVSALLVAFYLNRSSLEAAWKYVMVCSVGIAMALLGVILLYYAQVQAGFADGQPLSWLELRNHAMLFNPALVKLAVVFIIIGYGTKAGLAPMHTWLPDAHSQAPTPVSGLLSGALLSCAMYAIARNLAVINMLPEIGAVAGKLLTGFGIFSIAVAVPFLLLQHDIKRLLAYSSVENMGLIALGMGSGSPLGLYGALLHLINHAVGKSALFYVAGLLIHQYHTKQILRIRGIISAAPILGGLFVLIILAVSGMPPFSLFLSKLIIIQSLFADGWWLGLLALLLLAGVFAGVIYYMLSMAFGSPAAGMVRKDISLEMLPAILISLVILASTGVYLPVWLDSLLRGAAEIVMGGLYK
jgi:hydrogenase-4 component F